MIPRNTPPDTPVEVQWPDGWYSGYAFVRPVGAVDRDYRVIVRGTGSKSGWYLDGVAPECVREVV